MAMPDRISGQRVYARRLLIALTVSLLFHFLIVSGSRGPAGPRSGGPAPALQVRFQVPDIPVADLPGNPQPTAFPQTAPAAVQTGHKGRPATTESGDAAEMPRETRAAAHGSESRFYLARELDRYPVPLMPVVPGHQRDGIAGSVRLWVSIDHVGRVFDVAVADGDPAGIHEQSARDLMLATRFDPARKDGRAVKSRLLLMLEFGS